MKRYLFEAELIGTRMVTVEANSLVHAKAKFQDGEYENPADEYHVDHVVEITELED